jgi:hypothetical protein
MWAINLLSKYNEMMLLLHATARNHKAALYAIAIDHLKAG